MAITVLSQPSSITPSRNPVRWKLQTNNFVTNVGVKAVAKFQIWGGVGVSQKINFVYGNEDFEMVCSGLDNGFSIPIGAYSTAWLGLVHQAFLNNYYLNRDFDITLNAFTGEFTFTAKAVGSAYTLNASTDDMPNGQWTFTTIGVDYATRENFQIGVDIYVEDVYGSNNFTLLSSRHYKPDANSQVEFNIQDELHAFLINETNSPTFNQTIYSQCTKVNKRYYLKYFEQYGSTPVNYKQATSSTFRVIKGGIRHEHWPAVASDFRTQWLGLPSSGSVIPRFFITRRLKRNATKTQQEYLYFCPAAAMTSIRLRARVEYSNNTATIATIATYASLGQGITFLFPAGYTQLNLAALEAGRTPIRFYVYLDNTAGILKSEMIAYELFEPAHIERYFIYENSIGGAWETLRTTGQQQHDVEISKNEFEKILPFNYAADEGNIIKRTEHYHDLNEVFTGYYFTKDEANDLIDMLKSENMFELVGGKKVPVTVEPDSFLIDRDDNYQYGVKFKYRPVYKQTNYGWR